jgi:hypothetical protein
MSQPIQGLSLAALPTLFALARYNMHCYVVKDESPSRQSPGRRPAKSHPPLFLRLLLRTYLIRHVALGAGNVLHDVAEAHLQGVRLLLQQLVALLGTDALGL